MKDIVRQVLVLLSTMAILAINGLASASGLNGQTTGEISDRFQVYFVPAGYVFAIWGLIYLALIAYSIYQALPVQRQNLRLQRTGWLYVLSCAANIAWLF
jgi:benzodiazapine receptor